MINSLEKVDIKNEAYYSLTSESEIQLLRDLCRIYICLFIIKKSVSILLNMDNNND